jgi:hypothetical protein
MSTQPSPSYSDGGDRIVAYAIDLRRNDIETKRATWHDGAILRRGVTAAEAGAAAFFNGNSR